MSRARTERAAVLGAVWLLVGLAAAELYARVSGVAAPPSAARTSAELWAEYAASPDTHPNIPNCSYAGYHSSEAPLPAPPVVANVRETGALADGRADDCAAFRAALAKAASAGGGAVLVPAGTYRIGCLLRLGQSGVVLRGEGRGRTVLDFRRSLTELIGPLPGLAPSQWSWAGGLIWVGPDDTFDASGAIVNGRGRLSQQWEYWRPGRRLARVTAAAAVGDTRITVDAAGLQPGEMVLLSWRNPEDASLLKHLFGFGRTGSIEWSKASWILPPSYPRFQWPVRVEKTAGGVVTLKQPLRLAIRPEWEVAVEELGNHVEEVGVEHMTIELHAPATHRHLAGAGYNGVYFNRAFDSWLRDVEIAGAENGVVLAAAKNVTVSEVDVTGSHLRHHPFACRVATHDSLFEKFRVVGSGRVRHGINTEWLSSGNVWHQGSLSRGTFDSHRGLSFDSIRTDIDLRNDEGSAPGGADEAGPYLGKRVVHWNVRIHDSDRGDPGAYVNQPACLPLGALVGVSGAPVSSAAAPGDGPGLKGCLVVDNGKTPQPSDLFQAELVLRLAEAAQRPPAERR
jgi:hypothetical protein